MAGEKQVSYVLSLKDQFTAGINRANSATKQFESTAKSAMGMGTKLLGALGVGMAAYKGFEFIKEGVEKVHQLHMAEAQLDNTIAHIGRTSVLTGEQMVALADSMYKTLPVTKQSIIEAETALTRFKGISASTFKQAITMSADLAIALKRDSSETATMLGRVLENPEKAGRMLRQFNIILTTPQQQLIKQLQETGHVARAQQMIFKLLAEKGYAGAAAAAANADPYFKLNKAMEQLKLQSGELLQKVLIKFMPILKSITDLISKIIPYIQTHKELIEKVTVAIGGMMASIILITIATKAWAAAEAIATALNPWMLLALAIGAVTASNVLLADKSIPMMVKMQALLKTIINYTKSWGEELSGVYKVGQGIWGGKWGPNFKLIGQGFKQMSQETEGLSKIYNRNLSLQKQQADLDASTEKYIKIKNEIQKIGEVRNYSGQWYLRESENKYTKVKAPKGAKEDPTLSPSMIQGNKPTNIYITIGDLVKNLTFHTSNLQESLADIEEQVAQVLLKVVNDSQIVPTR